MSRIIWLLSGLVVGVAVVLLITLQPSNLTLVSAQRGPLTVTITLTFPRDDVTKKPTAMFYDGRVGDLTAVNVATSIIQPNAARSDSMHKIPAGDVECISYPSGPACNKLTDYVTDFTAIDEMVSANERLYDILSSKTYTIPADQSMLSTATITVYLPANALISANGRISCVQSPKPNACTSIPGQLDLTLPVKQSDPLPDLRAKYVFAHDVIAMARSLQ